jgi:hypothetical protein
VLDPRSPRGGEAPIDDASRAFSAFDRALGRRGTTTTRSREDANTIRALATAWNRTYRPQFVAVLGEFPAVGDIDREILEIQGRVGSNIPIADLRRRLRLIVRLLERQLVPAYDAARWTTASVQEAESPQFRQALVDRLDALSPELAQSYIQVHRDLADASRNSYLGPAGEIREVLRVSVHLLAPDEAVMAESWFVGDQGRPTQAERIRYIVQQSSGQEASPTETAEVVEQKVGQLGRTLYRRASRALHAGTQRDEVDRIVGYVEAVLNEILPA